MGHPPFLDRSITKSYDSLLIAFLILDAAWPWRRLLCDRCFWLPGTIRPLTVYSTSCSKPGFRSPKRKPLAAISFAPMRISLASFGLLTLLTLLPVGELLRLPQQGSVCDGNCPNGLECTCLALNRGLRICEPEGGAAPSFLLVR